MIANIALDRDALYYPSVHIRDVNWLKSTLLCFPNVRRMVPGNYSPRDSEEIRAFCEVMGPRNEPLLTAVDLFSPAAVQAQERLLRALQENDDFIRNSYSKERTIQEYGDKAGSFQIHDGKIIGPLHEYLGGSIGDSADGRSLVWTAPHPTDPYGRHWQTVHPRLGTAILSTIAIAIANDSGLDIVTDSVSVHHEIVSTDDGAIVDELLGKTRAVSTADQGDLTNRLAEIVMMTNFDVSRLTARQIADLLNDGKDLRRFKDAIMPIAARIPLINNPAEREKRLREASQEVALEWAKYRKSLPRFAADAIFDTSELKWPDIAHLLGGGGGGAALAHFGLATSGAVSSECGLGIAFLSYAGFKVWRKYKDNSSSAYQYLSRIRKAEMRTQAMLVLPPIGSWARP